MICTNKENILRHHQHTRLDNVQAVLKRPKLLYQYLKPIVYHDSNILQSISINRSFVYVFRD